MLIPGTCCRASDTDLSGNAPISVAEIESTKVGASFLTSWEVSRAVLDPTITTSCSSEPAESSAGAAAAALPGTANASPDAQANACNTARRTEPLIVLMHPPLVVKTSTSRTGERTKLPSFYFNPSTGGFSRLGCLLKLGAQAELVAPIDAGPTCILENRGGAGGCGRVAEYLLLVDGAGIQQVG